MKLLRSEVAKPWLLLALFLIAWWLLPVIFKNWVRNFAQEVQAPALYVGSKMSDLQVYWGLRSTSKNQLIELSRDLARANAAYSLKVQENAALRDEINSLESILGLPDFIEYESIPARVIARESSAWWQQLIIRIGSSSGIEAGMGVVYRGGIVGRIVQAGQYTSIVELISSPSFRCVAYLEGDGRPITYTGAGGLLGAQAHGRVSNVPKDIGITPRNPRQLLSSDLGEVFPNGLRLGELTALEPGARGLFQAGDVTLPLDLMDLREVAVLKPLKPESTE